MILTALDMKFHETKDEIPPEACRPLKKTKKKQCRKSGPPKLKNNNVEKVDPTKVKKQNHVGPDRTSFKQEPDRTRF